MYTYAKMVERKSGAALVVLSLFALAASAADWPPAGELEWEHTYDGKALPPAAVPSWRESIGDNTEATLESEGLRIADRGTADGNLHSYDFGWRAIPGQGAVVEGRVKLVNNTGNSGAYLFASDGVHETALTLYPDRIATPGADDNEIAYNMATTDGFHVYRLAIRNEDFLVWVDGQLAIDGQGKFTRPAYDGRNRVSFGSCSSAAVSEAVYAYVRFTTFGEVPPLPPRIAGAEDVVIYKQPGVYACFPNLTQFDDGALYTTFGTRTRRSHIDTTGGSARYVSKDKGRTWEPFKDEAPTTSFARCKDGSLVSAGAYAWREVPAERKAELKAQDIMVRDVRPGVVAYLQGAFVRRSSDNGKTWQSEELQLPTHRSLMGFNSGAHCMLSNGVRLVAVYGELKEDKVSRTFVLRSADDGKTWWFLPMAADPEGKTRLNETAIAANAQGEVVAMMRSEPPNGGYLYHSISKDGGISWSPAQRTEIWGYPAHLLLLKDGRMLCTYGYRREPMGICAALSTDGGHTWNADDVITLRNDGAPYGSDLGYPISVETEPGRIFTIYYFTQDDGITYVAGTHWQVPAP